MNGDEISTLSCSEIFILSDALACLAVIALH